MTDSSAKPSALQIAVPAVGLAALFAIYIYVCGITVAAVAYCLLGFVLLAVALIDLKTYTIPNIFVVGISLLFFAMVTMETVMGTPMPEVVGQVTDGLMGSLVVGGGMLLFSVVFDMVTGKMSLGGGDIKLLLAVNLFLGLKLSIANLVLSCILAVIFAAVSGVHKPEAEDAKFSQRVIPFGPAIALATVLTRFALPIILSLSGVSL